MAKQDFTEELIRVACTVAAKLLPGTLPLVTTNAKDVVQLNGCMNIEQGYQCRVVNGEVDW